jgi:tRNA (guanine-N7-)-methyltransferase
MDIKPEFKRKDIRSYVIRSGRMTEAQDRAFNDHWSNYGLSLFNGSLDTDKAFERKAPLVLEIGFGMGDSLWQMVKAEADKDFIGIEVHPPGVGSLISNAASE